MGKEQRAERKHRRKLMTKFVAGIALSPLLLALSFSVQGQQTNKVPRIGVLVPGSASGYGSRIEAFRKGLHELRYVEGQNVNIEYRYAEGKLDRLTELAAELTRLKVDMIVTSGGASVDAAKRATRRSYSCGEHIRLVGPGMWSA